MHPIRIFQHKYLIKSWKRRKVINCTVRHRPMIELYVDVDAVHHPDSAILILHRAHGYLSCCIFSLNYLVFSSKIIINYNPWFLISYLLPSPCQAYGKLFYKPYRFGWQLLLNFSCHISIDWYLWLSGVLLVVASSYLHWDIIWGSLFETDCLWATF